MQHMHVGKLRDLLVFQNDNKGHFTSNDSQAICWIKQCHANNIVFDNTYQIYQLQKNWLDKEHKNSPPLVCADHNN